MNDFWRKYKKDTERKGNIYKSNFFGIVSVNVKPSALTIKSAASQRRVL